MAHPMNVARAAQPPRALLAVLLIAVTLAVFWPATRGEFVYDDELLFGPTNPATASLGAALEHSFEPLWSFDQAAPSGAAAAPLERAFWRPLTVLALALGNSLPGPAPFGPHLVSLVLHLAAVWAAWRLAARLCQDELAGAAVALVFAVHPLAAEPVAWASAVNDPLAGALMLSALALHARRRAGALPLGAGALALLALLAKEQALVLPLLAWGVDRVQGRRDAARAFAPYGVAFALWYVARAVIFRDVFAGLLERQGDFGFPGLLRELSFRVELVGGALGLLVWPAELAVFRPVRPTLPEGDPSVWVGALWLGVFGALAAVAAWRRAQAALFGFGMAALAPLLVATALHTAGRYPLSDRYLYLSVFGAALGLVALTRPLCSPRWIAGAALLTALVFAPRTRAHLATFADSGSFHAHAVAAAPRDPYVRLNAGREELKVYRDTLDLARLYEAYCQFVVSLTLGTDHGRLQVQDDPTLPPRERMERLERMLHAPPAERRPDPTVFWTPYDRLEANLGQLYVHLFAATTSPIADFDVPLAIADQLSQVFGREGRVWTAKGQVHALRRELPEAETAFRRALELDQRDGLARRRLGQVLGDLGRLDEAYEVLRAGVALAPQDVTLLTNALAAALRRQDFAGAQELLDRVIAADAAGREAAFWRGRVALAEGRVQAALAAFDRALALDKGWGDALKYRGLALLMSENVEGALESLGAAAQVLPDDFEVHYQLAAVFSRVLAPDDDAGQTRLAALLVRAYELSPPTELRLSLQAELERFVAGDPGRAFSLGTSSEKRKDLRSARFWYERTVAFAEAWPELERQANSAQALLRLGSVMRQQGDRDEALAVLTRADALQPNRFDVNFELATTLAALGRKVEAGPHAERALAAMDAAGVSPDQREALRDLLRNWIAEARLALEAGPSLPPR